MSPKTPNPKKLTEERVVALTKNVENLQAALDSWKEVGIPRKTLVILLSHYTKVPQRTIRLVMEGMDALHDYYFVEEEE